MWPRYILCVVLLRTHFLFSIVVVLSSFVFLILLFDIFIRQYFSIPMRSKSGGRLPNGFLTGSFLGARDQPNLWMVAGGKKVVDAGVLDQINFVYPNLCAQHLYSHYIFRQIKFCVELQLHDYLYVWSFSVLGGVGVLVGC